MSVHSCGRGYPRGGRPASQRLWGATGSSARPRCTRCWRASRREYGRPLTRDREACRSDVVEALRRSGEPLLFCEAPRALGWLCARCRDRLAARRFRHAAVPSGPPGRYVSSRRRGAGRATEETDEWRACPSASRPRDVVARIAHGATHPSDRWPRVQITSQAFGTCVGTTSIRWF